MASILNDKNNILKTLLIDWNKIMPRTTVYNIFSTIYSTNHPCLQNVVDFRDLDAPSFKKTENEDDGNEVSAADQLIACLEKFYRFKVYCTKYWRKRRQLGIYVATSD